MANTSLPGLEVVAERENCCAFVSLSGEMDLANAAGVEDQIRVLGTSHAMHLVVDCAELTFIDSSGLNALLTAFRMFGGDLALVSIGSQMSKLLQVTGLRADGDFRYRRWG